MKLPEFTTVTINGPSTVGLLGITLVVLISLAKISPWWMILAVSCILSGIGTENRK
jgi:hypothetical protein